MWEESVGAIGLLMVVAWIEKIALVAREIFTRFVKLYCVVPHGTTECAVYREHLLRSTCHFFDILRCESLSNGCEK